MITCFWWIFITAPKLHIDTEVRRVIFIIETKHEKDSNALDNVRTLLGNRARDFVTAVDEKNIIVVKELEPDRRAMWSLRRSLRICTHF